MDPNLRLWYTSPASKWSDCLPIGNGKLGAMPFGNVLQEKWMLNEDSVWYGGPTNRNPPHALENLPKLRQLVQDGRLEEAEQLVDVAFVGVPESMRHYEPLGEVHLDFVGLGRKGAVDGYERYLDLNEAVGGVRFDVAGTEYTRELFASYPDNVIVSKLSTSKPELSFNLRLIRKGLGPDGNVYMDGIEVVDGSLVMKAQTGGDGVRMALGARVCVEGGSVEIIGETFVVKNASSATVILAAETTFRHADPQVTCLATIKSAFSIGYPQLRARHVEDYRALFSRVSFHLSTPSQVHLPTNIRMEAARKGNPDLGLITLYYQFGRYLLISSSRSLERQIALPANLQGIWNQEMSPPWGSKYTININTQMNYWLANTTNLDECSGPLFELLKRVSAKEKGGRTARDMYGCKGWACHHNTDIWADSAPQDRWLAATLWVLGGAWLCTHIWEHFLFTGDREFLAANYEIMKGSVDFYLDFLIEHDDGYLVTTPSLSPENIYRLPSGEQGSICIAPTMDTQILHALFTAFLSASSHLSQDPDTAARVRIAQSKLPPMQIGNHGQLQEWLTDVAEVEPGHRHISHLWGLYPGHQISERTPHLVDAAKKTLERRARFGGGHTGWSRAWMICLWARLGDGAEAGRQVGEILRTSTLGSLLDDHPPFQIDGNFGAVAGVTEMLLQSHLCVEEYEGNGNESQGVGMEMGFMIHLLPALPPSWDSGAVEGICARGGFVVGIKWEGGKVVSGSVFSKFGGRCVVRSKETVFVEGVESLVLGGKEKEKEGWREVVFETEKGRKYEFTVK